MSGSSDDLKERVRVLREEFGTSLAEAADLASLQGVRDRFLGRKSGALTGLLKSLGGLDADVRREAGQELNALKADLEAALQAAGVRLEAGRRTGQLERERIDVTLPGRPVARGRLHPLTTVRERLEDIFVSMGYEVFDGPEVDDDYHCF